MTNQNQSTQPNRSEKRIGTRLITPAHQQADHIAETFVPDENFDRFEALNIIKEIYKEIPSPDGGLTNWTPALFHQLEVYLKQLQTHDFHDGKPIVFTSVQNLAVRVGITPSQIQKNEKALFRLGAITWTDSGNHRRFGRRDEREKITEAFGVNLAPLASQTQALRDLHELTMQDRKRYQSASNALKSIRRKINSILLVMKEKSEKQPRFKEQEQRFRTVIENIKLNKKTPLDDIYLWTGQLQGILEELNLIPQQPVKELSGQPVDNSRVDTENSNEVIPHDREKTTVGPPERATHTIQTPNNLYINTTCSGSGKADAPADAGRELCSRRQSGDAGALPENRENNSESVCQEGDGSNGFGPNRAIESVLMDINFESFVRFLPDKISDRMPEKPSWQDLVDLAIEMLSELGISDDAWVDACRIMSLDGAALVVIIIAAKRYYGAPITSFGGYLRGMISAARSNELHLWPTISDLKRKYMKPYSEFC